MTNAAVFRRLDGDCRLRSHGHSSSPHRLPVHSAEEMVDSSCFCVKKRKWAKTQSFKQLAGGETGSTQEMYVFEKQRKGLILSARPCRGAHILS